MEHETAVLTCPICKHEHTAPVVQVVDVDLDKETWKSVQDGRLFRFDCPDCGYPMEMSYSFLCQDSAIRQYIYLCRDNLDESGALQEAARRAKQLARGSTSDDILRVVCTMDELEEKLRVFESGLDDRMVEVCKGFALSQFPAGEECYAQAVLYDVMGGQEMLRVKCSDGTEQYVTAFREMYEQLYREYAGLFPPLRGERFLRVDLEYAAAALRGEEVN